MDESLTAGQRSALLQLALRLVDQRHARIAVAPYASAEGYWFGGGNMIEGAQGELYLVGRFRNAGDSRTGLAAGERGLELAVFVSRDRGRSFSKLVSLSRGDLEREGERVVSIEGSSLHLTERGVELYVSTEKGEPYPAGFERFQKPGTGVWSIDLLRAATVEELAGAASEPLLRGSGPESLHVKDPVVRSASSGETALVFCHHPYSWSSSNAGVALRSAGSVSYSAPCYSLFPRGLTWDVAVSRITDFLAVPRTGLFAAGPECTLVFYDGAECVRQHPDNPLGVARPRGYSCEELGGLAFGLGSGFGGIAGASPGALAALERLSTFEPLFLSPYGSGSSRYVHLTAVEEGIFATWQQSQADRSQPLVINFLPRLTVGAILGGERRRSNP